MPVQLFLAEWVAPVTTELDLPAIHSLLARASLRLSDCGTPVHLLRSSYLPGQRRWIGAFSAAQADDVHRAVEIAQLPAVQVSHALELGSPNTQAWADRIVPRA
jgi:hypothetical protein